jgi:hypothetical protein
MALPTVDLLSTQFVAAFLSTYPGSFDRLGIRDARARLRIPVQANPNTFPDSPVDPLPSTVDAAFPEVMVDGRPPRKFVWE